MPSRLLLVLAPIATIALLVSVLAVRNDRAGERGHATVPTPTVPARIATPILAAALGGNPPLVPHTDTPLPTVTAVPTATAPVVPSGSAAEWAAVQTITTPWDAHGVLVFVDNATGLQIINYSGILGITPSQFLDYQAHHPAYMMAAIQQVLQTRIWDSYTDKSYSIEAVESYNDTAQLINVNGLTPAQEADLFTSICTSPPATDLIPPLVMPTPLPTDTPLPSRLVAQARRLMETFAPVPGVTGRQTVPYAPYGEKPSPYEGQWVVQPPHVDVHDQAEYDVYLNRTVHDAQEASQRDGAELLLGCAGVGSGCSVNGPKAPLVGHPAGGWMKGGCTNWCAYTAETTYHALQLIVKADCRPAEERPCQAYVERVLQFLVDRAPRF